MKETTEAKTKGMSRIARMIFCAVVLATASGCTSLSGNMRATERPAALLSSRDVEKEIQIIGRRVSGAKDDAQRAAIAREELDGLTRRIPVSLDERVSGKVSQLCLRLNRIVLRSEGQTAIIETHACLKNEIDVTAAVERAEVTVQTLDSCLAAGILDKADEHTFRAERRKFKQFVVHNLHELCITRTRDALQAARSPEDVLFILEDAGRTVKKLADEEGWSSTELERLGAEEQSLHRMEQLVTEQRGEATKKCEDWIAGQQGQFVNTSAVTDLESANSALDGERQKAFNWRIFRYFRDNVRILDNALLLCDRVQKDGRVEYALRQKAAEKRNTTWERLNAAEQGAYYGLPQMPGYDALPGFPDYSAAEKADLIAEAWRQQREVQPPAEAGDLRPISNTLIITQ